MSSNGKSSAELEREVEASRADMSGTIEELRNRMSPGQLAGEAWDFAASSDGGSFVRNLGTSIRDNPLPIALIGAGIAWLMSGRGGGLPRLPHDSERWDRAEDEGEDIYDYRRYQGDRRRFTAASLYSADPDDPAYSRPYTLEDSDGAYVDEDEEAGEGGGMRETLAGAGKRARDYVSGAAADLGDRASHTAGALGDRASHTAGALGDSLSAAGERASELAGRTAHRARRLRHRAGRSGRQMGTQARRFVDEQPLTLAFAGLALGALAGALFRQTDAESQLMGEYSDSAKRQARRMAQEGAQRAAGAAQRTFEAVQDEAEAQGLTAEGAQDAAETLGDKVGKVVERGREQVREEVGAATDSGGSEART